MLASTVLVHRPSTWHLRHAGDLVAVTLAMEQPGSNWCGIQRGTVLGPDTSSDRWAAQHHCGLRQKVTNQGSGITRIAGYKSRTRLG